MPMTGYIYEKYPKSWIFKLPIATPKLPTISGFKEIVANSINIKIPKMIINAISLKIINPLDKFLRDIVAKKGFKRAKFRRNN